MARISGDRKVVQAIAALKEEPEVIQCLRALFTYELQNSELKVPRFAETYEREIDKYSQAWIPDGQAE